MSLQSTASKTLILLSLFAMSCKDIHQKNNSKKADTIDMNAKSIDQILASNIDNFKGSKQHLDTVMNDTLNVSITDINGKTSHFVAVDGNHDRLAQGNEVISGHIELSSPNPDVVRPSVEITKVGDHFTREDEIPTGVLQVEGLPADAAPIIYEGKNKVEGADFAKALATPTKMRYKGP